jgi:hypothetical protein
MQHHRPAAMAGHRNDAMTDPQTYYHGTKADLNMGDLIVPGHLLSRGKRCQGQFRRVAADQVAFDQSDTFLMRLIWPTGIGPVPT